MVGRVRTEFLALSLGGMFILSSPAVAQQADAGAGDATSVTPPGNNADGPPKKLGQGTSAQAEHSAEATAHKSVKDPNNQLGTSLQGRTRPVASTDASPQNGAPASQPAVPAQ
jgi:hypothetical protein